MTTDREKAAAYRKAYREANREKVRAGNRKYKEANREKVLAEKRKYREANREKIRAYLDAKRDQNNAKSRARRASGLVKSNWGATEIWRERRYKLNPDQQRALLHTIQQNLCGICGRPLGKGRAVHLDHCHTTGAVRGFLCMGCNIMEGWVSRNLSMLNTYLSNPPALHLSLIA